MTDDPTPPARRLSGDDAIEAADGRAGSTRNLNIADVAPLPVPADTANLRLGPELHPDCLSLLPLVGVWRGTGTYGNEPRDHTSPAADFGQQITVSHDGRPFLKFEAVSWTLTPGSGAADGAAAGAGAAAGDRAADGAGDATAGPGAREIGWFRPQPDGAIELLLAHAEGRIEVFYGRPRSVASWALSTDGVWRTPTAVPVTGATRLYGVTPDGRLAYVEERAHTDAELAPHASALLTRLTG